MSGGLGGGEGQASGPGPRLHAEYRVVATAPNVAAAEVQRQAAHFLRPLTVTVDGSGGSGGGGECVTAANSAHVTAGRATSWLLFAWAVGSNDYLGATWATTSLRRDGNNWEMVTSCA